MAFEGGDEVQGVLPYTLIPKTDTTPATVLFLLWKDKKSTAVQSASYWSEINCEKQEDDPTVLDTVCRDFSEKTRGIFAPLPKKGEKVPSLKAQIKASATSLNEKIRKMNGCWLLWSPSRRIYVVPVRYVDAVSISRHCATKGQAEWVQADHLVAALQSDQPSNRISLPRYINPASASSVAAVSTSAAATSSSTSTAVTEPMVAVYLAFIAFGRASTTLEELQGLLRQYQPSAPSLVAAASETKRGGDEKDGKSSTPSKKAATLGSEDGVTEIYCCWKCRNFLFTNLHLLPHEPAPLTRSHHVFAEKARQQQLLISQCTSYFISSPPAALGKLDEADGKILCPGCKVRVGDYVWSGAQCSCGGWVTPALQLTKSKVDKKPFIAPIHRSPRGPRAVAAPNTPASAVPSSLSLSSTPSSSTSSSTAATT